VLIHHQDVETRDKRGHDENRNILAGKYDGKHDQSHFGAKP
jgi:hypothetical protein